MSDDDIMSDNTAASGDTAAPGDTAASGDTADRPGRDRRRPGQDRIMLPWWGLSGLCAIVGFFLAQWAGAVIAGGLGYLAWRLR